MTQEEQTISNNQQLLIIGAGIAGIQAALDIADAGFKVYLVEREPSIGGHMSQLDKTFPTLDCSACIMTPKMVDVARHPNIEMLTYSEVEWVEGEAGIFRAGYAKRRAAWTPTSARAAASAPSTAPSATSPTCP